MRKKILIFVGIVVVIIIALIIIRGNSKTTVAYVYANVAKGTVTQTVSASGNVNPVNLYNVNPRVSAKVLEVNVAAGDLVKAGQQLARLDDTDLQSAVKSAQYNLNSAVYARDQVQAMPVVDQNNVKKAQQQVNTASVSLQTAKNNLNNAIVTAPIDGKVLSVNIKPGDYASLSGSSSSAASNATATATAGLQPAFTIGDNNALVAYLSVNEIDINKIQLGQEVNSTIDAVNNTLTGKVLSIAPSGTAVTGIIYYQVEVSISDQTGLRPNMSVNADIVTSKKENVLTIPAAAIQVVSGKSIVRVPLKAANGTVSAQEKEITVGLNDNTSAEVLSGLNDGDQVIMNYNNATSAASSLFNFGGSSSPTTTGN